MTAAAPARPTCPAGLGSRPSGAASSGHLAPEALIGGGALSEADRARRRLPADRPPDAAPRDVTALFRAAL